MEVSFGWRWLRPVILMLCPHHVMLWLWLLQLLLLTCGQREALLAASTVQVLKIHTGVWPHAEETKVSPSGPPVPSNNDGSPKKGHSRNCSKHVGWLQKCITLPSVDAAFNRESSFKENSYVLLVTCRIGFWNICTCVTTILIPQTHTHSSEWNVTFI